MLIGTKMSIALIEVFGDDHNQAFRFLRIVDASKMGEIPQYAPITLEAGTTRVIPVPLQEAHSLTGATLDTVRREHDDFEKFEDLVRRRVQHAVTYSEQRQLGNETEFVELSDVMPITPEESMKQRRQELMDSKSAFMSELLDHDFANPRLVAREQQFVCISVSVEGNTLVLNVFAAFESTREADSYANMAVTRGEALSMEVLQSCKWFSSHDFKTTNLPQTVYVDNAAFMNSMMQKASENMLRASSMQKTAQNLGGDLIAGDTPPVQVVHSVEGVNEE
jgi:hypothetical protein